MLQGIKERKFQSCEKASHWFDEYLLLLQYQSHIINDDTVRPLLVYLPEIPQHTFNHF